MHLVRPTPARLGDRFEIRAESGSGGMGTVYRATDLLSGQDVALKVVHQGPGVNDRFQQEAGLLAELQHPAIVRYVDHGTTPAGDQYLAMEWLDGQTLDERLARGPLTVGETLRLGRRLLEALAVAHRKGIIHRDIKPANLFLPGGDLAQVKLLDFGIVRRVFDTRRITMTGAALGTPMYMSPEQVRGSKQLDGRSDVFSLGCVLFECALGEPPFTGETPMAVLAKICLDEPVEVAARRPDLPPAFAALLTRMLAKTPESRPDDAGALAHELGELLDTLAREGFTSGVHNLGLSRSRSPLLATGEQRVASAILVSRPRAGALPVNDAGADVVGTWDLPSTVTRQHLSGDLFDEGTFAEIRRALDPFGARVDRFLGGSMIVTLVGQGTPTDQAAQAARCALKLKSLLPRACLAVCTGRVVVDARLPLGDVIDAAARLLGGADTGTVRVDEMTARLLEARFELDEERQLLFEKGLKEAPRTLLGREIPCVGRDRELGTLEAIHDECVNEPVARAVLVTAPAGGGKSRVRHELLERIQGRGASFEYLVGRGESLRAGAPFGLLGPAIRGAAGILGGEPPDVQQKRLFAHVSRHVTGDGARRVAAFLGEMAGVQFPDDDLPPLKAARADARLMADQMLSAWLDFVEAACAAQPVVLVLEDLHWGDAPSVQFVDAALRNLRERPLLVLAFARPEVDERFPNLWAERDLQRVSLPPLTPRAAQKLARAALGDVAPEQVAWLIERADGNPFYLEELLRAVSEDGEASARGLPDTIVGMVQARLDALGADAKRVLRAASVYGQSFRAAGIEALVGDTDLGDWLHILTAKEVIYPRQAADVREYVFRHALVQEAAYAMLTPQDRVLGHKLAGEYLEAAGEPNAIVLVEHFERAGENARAARWCVRASEQALEGNDLAAVIERVERGVRLGAEGEVLAAMKVVEAQARFWRGEYVEAERAATTGVMEARDAGTRIYAKCELIAAQGQLGRYERVHAETVNALSDLNPCGPPATELLIRAAGYMVPAGQFGTAEKFLRDVGRLDDLSPGAQAQFRNVEASLAFSSGDHSQAIDYLGTVVELLDAQGDTRRSEEARVNLAVALCEVGALEEAEQCLRRALTSAERFGLGYVRACALVNLTQVLAYLDRFEEAKQTGVEARRVAQQQGDLRALGGADVYLSMITRLLGDYESSWSHARKALASLKTLPTAKPVAEAAVARALLYRGDVQGARRAAVSASNALEAIGRVEEGEAFIRLTIIECYLASNDTLNARIAAGAAASRLRSRMQGIKRTDRALTFASRIPYHARTFELARQLGVEH